MHRDDIAREKVRRKFRRKFLPNSTRLELIVCLITGFVHLFLTTIGFKTIIRLMNLEFNNICGIDGAQNDDALYNFAQPTFDTVYSCCPVCRVISLVSSSFFHSIK